MTKKCFGIPEWKNKKNGKTMTRKCFEIPEWNYNNGKTMTKKCLKIPEWNNKNNGKTMTKKYFLIPEWSNKKNGKEMTKECFHCSAGRECWEEGRTSLLAAWIDNTNFSRDRKSSTRLGTRNINFDSSVRRD